MEKNREKKRVAKTYQRILILGLSCIFMSTLIACKKATIEEDTNLEYTHISQSEAKEIMDSDEDIIILDVRSQEEYDQGHIEGAIVIPHTQIEEKAEELLPNKNQTILVYCRSGVRSVVAAGDLVDLGYTEVKEIGGIITWEYEVVTE